LVLRPTQQQFELSGSVNHIPRVKHCHLRICDQHMGELQVHLLVLVPVCVCLWSSISAAQADGNQLSDDELEALHQRSEELYEQAIQIRCALNAQC
jgi:hypothetical protein